MDVEICTCQLEKIVYIGYIVYIASILLRKGACLLLLELHGNAESIFFAYITTLNF